MEPTDSIVDLLRHFGPIFTSSGYVTFAAVVTGRILSHRRRYVTDVIFFSGNGGNGHWWRFHHFFSHAAWHLDTLSLQLAKLIVTILMPRWGSKRFKPCITLWEAIDFSPPCWRVIRKGNVPQPDVLRHQAQLDRQADSLYNACRCVIEWTFENCKKTSKTPLTAYGRPCNGPHRWR